MCQRTQEALHNAVQASMSALVLGRVLSHNMCKYCKVIVKRGRQHA